MRLGVSPDAVIVRSMRRMILLALLAIAVALPAAAQQRQGQRRAPPPAEPHAFLFGTWIGGTFPPPRGVPAARCLAMPSIIITRDLVMRTTLLDQTLRQRVVQSVRVTPEGWEFRFRPAPPPSALGGGLLGGATPEPGFGCGDDPNLLVVQRRGANEIAFPNCTDFPSPLVRCPAQ